MTIGPDMDFITRNQGLSRHLVNQYVGIIKDNEKPDAKNCLTSKIA